MTRPGGRRVHEFDEALELQPGLHRIARQLLARQLGGLLMKRSVFAAVFCLALAGCGNGEGDKTPVKLEDIPAPAMKTAKEKAPDATFTEAFQTKKDGVLEIRGKTKTGKVIEVEVKDDGTFVDIERQPPAGPAHVGPAGPRSRRGRSLSIGELPAQFCFPVL